MEKKSSLSLLLAVAVNGCAADYVPDEVHGWLGASVHVVVKGRVNGKDLDFTLSGPEAESGATVWCERVWIAPELPDGTLDVSKAVHDEADVKGYVTVNGQARLFRLELRGHNAQADPIDTAVTIVSNELTPDRSQGWFWFQWLEADATKLWLGQPGEGTWTKKLFTGTPGEGGVIEEGDGYLGAYVTARFSPVESFTLSFTAHCTESDTEPPE